jgi:Asp-tRNA(Asn)/Glu-tRNA(Gln) amidotransferase A subunit family amidase
VALETAGFSSVEPEAAKAIAAFQERLVRHNVRVLTRSTTSAVADTEDVLRDAGTLSRKINAWESRWPLNTYARDIGMDGLSPIMRARLKEAESMSLEEYQGLLEARTRCREIYSKLATVADACITLGAPGPAPVGIASTGDPAFAIPGSLLGVPALSMPMFEISGMPLGLQVLGFSERDSDLFAVAAALQETTA